MRVFDAIRPPDAHASIRAASLTSSPSAVTSLRPVVVIHPTYAVAPQCSPKRRTAFALLQLAAGRHAGHRLVADRERRRCRLARRRLRPRGLGEKERAHAVADMPADQAAAVHDAPVGGYHEPAADREVAGGRQAPGEAGRSLEVGEQDRRRSPGGLRDAQHPSEVVEIALRRDRPERRHAHHGLVEQRGAGSLPSAAWIRTPVAQTSNVDPP